MVGRDFADAVGARLRGIREQQGLSLHELERKSGGRWKAVAVSGWERGYRTPTARTLAELADFYGVPPSALMSDAPTRPAPLGGRIVIDLAQLRELTDPDAGRLAGFVADIQRRRFDYNGRMLSLRATDLGRLALIYDTTPEDVIRRMQDWAVLWTGPALP